MVYSPIVVCTPFTPAKGPSWICTMNKQHILFRQPNVFRPPDLLRQPNLIRQLNLFRQLDLFRQQGEKGN